MNNAPSITEQNSHRRHGSVHKSVTFQFMKYLIYEI